MPTSDLAVAPPFAFWPSTEESNPFPTVAVEYHQTTLDTPEMDQYREATIAGFERLSNLQMNGFSSASAEERILLREREKWLPRASAPRQLSLDESLGERFKGWNGRKQRSFVTSVSAYQVHSFAIENKDLPEGPVRTALTAALLKQR